MKPNDHSAIIGLLEYLAARGKTTWITAVENLLDVANRKTDLTVMKKMEKLAPIEVKMHLLYRINLFWSINETQLCSKDRHSPLKEIRFIYVYLLYKYTGLSLEKIGQFVGDRDHSTILNAVEKAQLWIKSDAYFRERVNLIETDLQINFQVVEPAMRKKRVA